MKLLISLSASITEGHVFLNPVYFLKTNGLTLKDSYGKREIDPGAVAAALCDDLVAEHARAGLQRGHRPLHRC